MPVYEYSCDQCGKRVEVLAPSMTSTQPPDHCPCGQERSFTRVYSAFAARGASSNGADLPDCCGEGRCGDHSAGCSCCH